MLYVKVKRMKLTGVRYTLHGVFAVKLIHPIRILSPHFLPLALLAPYHYRILVKGHLGLQQCRQVRAQGAIVQYSERHPTHASWHDLAAICKE